MLYFIFFGFFAEGRLENYVLSFEPSCYQRSERINYLLSSVSDNIKATSELYRKDKEGEGSLQPKARISPRLEGNGVKLLNCLKRQRYLFWRERENLSLRYEASDPASDVLCCMFEPVRAMLYLLYFRVSVKIFMNESSLIRKSFLFFHMFVISFPFLACPSLAGESFFVFAIVIFHGAWCCECGCTAVERKNECARLGRKDMTATLPYLRTGCSQFGRTVQGFGSEEEREREREKKYVRVRWSS